MKSPRPKTTKPLTHRQERFVHEFLLDQNATAAAARAGYSAKTKGSHAALLMTDERIRRRIAVELADLYARLKFNALELLRVQLRAAYFDPAKLFDAQEEPIPLDALDEETRGAVTVSYSRRRNGDHVRHVRQVPRHVALNILQRRLDNFEKLQREAFAQASAEEEAQAPRRAPGIFDIPLRLEMAQPVGEGAVVEAPEEAALGRATKKAVSHASQEEALGSAPKEAALGHERSESPWDAPEEAALGHVMPAFPEKIPFGAPSKGTSFGAQAVKGAGGEVPAAAQAAPAAPGGAEAAQVAASAPASTLTPQQQADVAAAAADPQAPPSPYEAGYDFKKDPNATYGGRFAAWNRYWKERRAREQAQAEEAAALRNPPANMRIGPGKTVPVRMEPGYNPPWLRSNRPEFAIGAGECWMD